MRSLLAAAPLLPGCAVAAVLSVDAGQRFPGTGRYVVAEGVRLPYVEKGERRPIVLLLRSR